MNSIFLEREEKLCVLFTCMEGMGWSTAPTTDAAPRRRSLREFGAEQGDKRWNTRAQESDHKKCAIDRLRSTGPKDV
jgi:hypothetical protein